MRKMHHLTMVSLLITTCILNESLPLFIDAVTNPVVAIVLSVVLTLVFGEIIPNAICTGPRKLEIV